MGNITQSISTHQRKFYVIYVYVVLLLSLIANVENTSSKYYRRETSRLTITNRTLWAPSELSCCGQCEQESFCNCVNYHKLSNTCQLSALDLKDLDANNEVSDEWTAVCNTGKQYSASNLEFT